VSRVFFNIHAQGVKDYKALIDYARSYRPKWALVMDGVGMALDLKAASPLTNVIHRAYKPDGYWLSRSPEDFLMQAYQEVGSNDLWVYVENEVGLQAAWFTRLLEANAKKARPLKLVIANCSVGTPDVKEWETPAAQKLLRLASQYREWCVIGLHEYFQGLATTGFQDNHIITDPAKWPRAVDAGKNDWLCNRVRWMIKACKDFAPPRVVITEFGTDSIAVIEQAVGKLEGGWRNAVAWWNKYLPGLTADEAAYTQAYYLDEVAYKPGGVVEAELWYCYGSIDPRWQAYDVEPLAEFRKLLDAWQPPKLLPDIGAKPQTPPAPEPTPDPPPQEPEPETPPPSETPALVSFTRADVLKLAELHAAIAKVLAEAASA
jgi:hypothetical protein